MYLFLSLRAARSAPACGSEVRSDVVATQDFILGYSHSCRQKARHSSCLGGHSASVKFSCVTIFLLFRPTVLLADAGLPMIAVTFPGMILLLLPVIAIEAVVLRLRLSLPLQRALKVSGVANVVSMLAGIPATWFVLTLCEMGFMAAADALTNPARSQDSAMERIVAVIVTAPWLPPPEGGLWRVPLAILILLVPFFLVSVWVEGLVAKRMLRDVSNDLESRSWRKGSQSASDTLKSRRRSAEVQAKRSQPSRDFRSSGSAAAWTFDRGISAWDVVTDMRKAHGSV
jgi:hypothetical protein